MKDTIYLPPRVHAWNRLRMDDYVFLNKCRDLAIMHSNKPVIARGFVSMYFSRMAVIYS